MAPAGRPAAACAVPPTRRPAPTVATLPRAVEGASCWMMAKPNYGVAPPAPQPQRARGHKVLAALAALGALSYCCFVVGRGLRAGELTEPSLKTSPAIFATDAMPSENTAHDLQNGMEVRSTSQQTGNM